MLTTTDSKESAEAERVASMRTAEVTRVDENDRRAQADERLKDFATAAFPAGPLLDQAKIGALLSVTSAAVTLVAAAVLGVRRLAAKASPAGRP